MEEQAELTMLLEQTPEARYALHRQAAAAQVALTGKNTTETVSEM